MKQLNLGNPEFNKKLRVYYSWIAPVSFALFACLLLAAKAYVSAIPVLMIVIVTAPALKKINGRLSVSMKVLISCTLLLTAIYSTCLYV